jgi:membrane protein DedA with SNARE-associated domain
MAAARMQFLAFNFLTDSWGWLVHGYRSFDAIKFVEHWMGSDWGYGVLFGLLLSCGLGMPLPEDIPLMIAGYFVADGKMNLAVVSTCAWCGIMCGDCILYTLGYHFGWTITKLPIIGSHINKDRLTWAHERFEKYGVWMVAIGRLFAGVRGVMVLTAGTIRFTFTHFVIADGLAAIASGGLFIALGYWGRMHLGSPDQVEAWINHYKLRVTLGIVGLVLFYIAWHYWQYTRRQKRKQVAIQQARLREAASSQD